MPQHMRSSIDRGSGQSGGSAASVSAAGARGPRVPAAPPPPRPGHGPPSPSSPSVRQPADAVPSATATPDFRFVASELPREGTPTLTKTIAIDDASRDSLPPSHVCG